MNSTHEKLAQSLKLTLDEDQLTNCILPGPTFLETLSDRLSDIP